ncbi:MAG: Spy/CpxP family protein refolding chaperone [Candidatus Cloacimonetes bacterium]|nr:Spy/CpxP family protein refolding chaperone [Candidatus Cloacimonadota bacterium]MCF7813178.1 Spy/CpxP family protein refolding chaperone [Candidatus Cloacimonadota bacterium]MCF7867626.1 Spy/CpxP family protein refolding chaperone [Candidatus Cloacimonadota bacterium]MCF7883099.1 Spy/CpxP family protein refolding chaperone [Candidatus Cloacimonadota bacterium]
MKRIIVTLVLVVGIAAALAAFDGMGERNGWQGRKNQKMMNQEMQHHGMGNPMGMLCENLDLTDAQKDKIDELKIAHDKKMIQLHADEKILQVDKKTAMMDQDFAKVKKLTDKIYDRKKDIALAKIDHHEDVWNELTPEQQEEAKEMRMMGHQNRKMQNKKMEHCKEDK